MTEPLNQPCIVSKNKKMLESINRSKPSKFCNTLTKINKLIKLEEENLSITCARE